MSGELALPQANREREREIDSTSVDMIGTFDQ